jgi:hypothetical protein
VRRDEEMRRDEGDEEVCRIKERWGRDEEGRKIKEKIKKRNKERNKIRKK